MGALILSSVVPIGFAVKKIKTLSEESSADSIKYNSSYASRESQLKLKQQQSSASDVFKAEDVKCEEGIANIEARGIQMKAMSNQNKMWDIELRPF